MPWPRTRSGYSRARYAGAYGYRREVRGSTQRLPVLAGLTAVGAVIGGGLLVAAPPRMFGALAPPLIALGCLIVLLQPVVSRLFRTRPRSITRERPLFTGVFLAGGYGGYFGAGQGVLLMALLSAFTGERVQQVNAARNVLAAVGNLVAAAMFVAIGSAGWAVLPIAVGAASGGRAGAALGRVLPPWLIRAGVAAVGSVALLQLL